MSDLNNLAERIERRIDNLETKIDTLLVDEAKNRTDIMWVKGFIKLSLTTVISAIGAIILGLVNLYLRQK